MGCKAYKKTTIGDCDYEVAEGTAYFSKYAVIVGEGKAAVLPSFQDGVRRYKPIWGVPVITIARDLNLAAHGQIEKVAFEGDKRIYIVWKGHSISDPIMMSEQEIMELADAFEHGVRGHEIYDVRLREGSLTGLKNFGEAGAACFMLNESGRWEVADMMP